MKHVRRVLAMVLLLTMGTVSSVRAAEYGAYCNGVEGIKAATLPPEGFYVREYFYHYHASRLNDIKGNKVNCDYDADVWSLVNRLIWVTPWDVLGADYAMDVLVPFAYKDVSAVPLGIRDHHTGLGDICVEPIVLAWHQPRFDIVAAGGVFLPTGAYKQGEGASLGNDHWTTLLTAGATYYFDAKRTWTASILNRYQLHSKENDVSVTPGNNLSFEWGVGKTFVRKWLWDVGISGYNQWQTTGDTGSAVTYDKGDHDRVFALGPELGVMIPSCKLSVSIRTQWEVYSRDRPQGSSSCIVVTKGF